MRYLRNSNVHEGLRCVGKGIDTETMVNRTHTEVGRPILNLPVVEKVNPSRL